ncbi:MAG: hypothetical protein ACJ8E8_12895 [Sphingomicrobium sp.]
MSARISPRHRAAFLEALAESGNYRLAAAQVKVSRDWAFKLRRREPAFDAACREAVEIARIMLTDDAMLGTVPPLAPPAGGRGTVVQRGKGRRVQVKRARAKQWTGETERRFLTALATSCNVKLAAAEVGFSAFSAHYRRRHDPGFARRWAEALEIGYVRLEAALVESAICYFEGEQIPDDNPIAKMSVAEAIQSLNMNKFAVRGEGKGRPGKRAVSK